MAPDANPPRRTDEQRAADDERLASIAAALGDALDEAVPPWIERLVVERLAAWRGDVSDAERAEARAAGEAARSDVVPRLRGLLATDVDQQAVNPLALLREVTRHARDVLARHRVPAVDRDEFSVRSFPDDLYDLAPATWSDIDPGLQEPGIAWGAAKAYIFKARRRDEGRG